MDSPGKPVLNMNNLECFVEEGEEEEEEMASQQMASQQTLPPGYLEEQVDNLVEQVKKLQVIVSPVQMYTRDTMV
jgi:hypothetical protein